MILYNPLRFNAMLLSNCSSKWSLPFPLSNQNSARLSYHSLIGICLRHLIHHNVVILIILTFCWPCILLYLSQYLTNLMHKICFTIRFISCLYIVEYMCSSSGGHNCITQPLVSSHLIVWCTKFVSQYVLFHASICSSTCAHHQEVIIVLYSLWYHHT